MNTALLNQFILQDIKELNTKESGIHVINVNFLQLIPIPSKDTKNYNMKVLKEGQGEMIMKK